jgi:transcriptional regulator with XRE-family HTH domain
MVAYTMAESINSIPERIKAIRVALKLSQRAFAKGVFVSQGYFAEIEVGKRAISERIIQLIVTQYKVNKEWLKTGTGDMFSASKTEIKLEYLSGIFSELDEVLQDYLIKQADELLIIQKKKITWKENLSGIPAKFDTSPRRRRNEK